MIDCRLFTQKKKKKEENFLGGGPQVGKAHSKDTQQILHFLQLYLEDISAGALVLASLCNKGMQIKRNSIQLKTTLKTRISILADSEDVQD